MLAHTASVLDDFDSLAQIVGIDDTAGQTGLGNE